MDWERRLIHIREGKGGKERTLPCSEELLADLKHLVGQRKTGRIFQSNRGKGFDLSQINKIVAQVGRLAGFKHPNPRYRNINPHLLRHSFAHLWKARR